MTDRRSMRVQAARKRLSLAYLAATAAGDVGAVRSLQTQIRALGTTSRPRWARRAATEPGTSSPGPLAPALDACMNRIGDLIGAAG